MPTADPLSSNRSAGPRRRWAAWLALVGVGLAGATLVVLVHAGGGPEEVARRLGPAAPWAIVPVLALISATPFPSELFVIPFSGIFGFHSGAWMTWLAWMGSSFIQYFLARRISRDLALERHRARLPGWLRRLPVSHPLFLICARWFPWGPHVVNTAAGLGRVELLRYAWCAAVGIAPQAVLLSAVGNALL